MKITFTPTFDLIPEKYYPKSASKFIPEWYQESKSYMNDEKIPDGLVFKVQIGAGQVQH